MGYIRLILILKKTEYVNGDSLDDLYMPKQH